MFLPFKNLSTRQSAAYAALCVALGFGIKYMDDHMPQRDPSAAKGDAVVPSMWIKLTQLWPLLQAWSVLDERADVPKSSS